LLDYVRGIKRTGKDLKAEYDALVSAIATEDEWILFQRKVRNFVTLYEALAPDPSVLTVTDDLKWFANFLRYGKQVFEKKEALEQGEYSAKIREMLEEHLKVTGLTTVIKLRSVVDAEFWDDFETEGKAEEELKTAALRKTTELRKITEAKLSENHHQYAKFSEKLRELIEKLDDTQLSWSDKLRAAEDYARELNAEASAHKASGLSPAAHAVMRVIQSVEGADSKSAACRALAEQAEALYTDPQLAPKLWQTKEGVRKGLRQHVRTAAHKLGFKRLKELPVEIEDIAIKHYGRSNFEHDCECVAQGQLRCNHIPCRTTTKRAEREGWGPLE
jgi:type I restriction enzyme R subunit